MKHLLVAIACLLFAASLSAQANEYSAWPNFPQSSSFFPISVFLQPPNRTMGSGSPYATDAAAMVGTKINTLLYIDNGGGGGWPGSYGVDTNGQFALLVANGLHLIAMVDYTDNTSATSVASVQAIATAQNATQYLIGWGLGDEPESGNGCTSVVPNIPSYISTVKGYDSTHPIFWNMTDWVFGHGSCGGPPDPNIAALQAINVGSFDEYPLTSPWNGGSNIPVVSGQPQDSMWIEGSSVAQFIANGRSGQPIMAFVDTGTNELGYSTQGGDTCSTSTNLCTPDNHEYRATAEQVNAEVWMAIINGAMGIEYFCDDISLATGNTAYDFCLGNNVSGEGTVAAAIASNLTYVNTNLLNFAPQLNSPVLGRCTMDALTGVYTGYTTSCSNGILTMSTGTSTVPGSAIVKNYNGTLYLFADPDRNGSASFTFGLGSTYAGWTATVAYDSDAQYNSTYSTVGKSFTLNSSGQFSDTLGANGDNYQPKIYKITGTGSGAPPPPTNLQATVV